MQSLAVALTLVILATHGPDASVIVARGARGAYGQNQSAAAPRAAVCAPLPPITGNIIRVAPDQAERLGQIVASAPERSVILLADGFYRLRSGLLFRRPNVTMRSMAAQDGISHDPKRVVIDGLDETTRTGESGDPRIPELIGIMASGVTIADVSLRNAKDHLIHVQTAGSNVVGVKIYNTWLSDPGEQAIKINTRPGDAVYADEGEVACAHIELTDSGRTRVERAHADGCYTGGIDAHQSRGWRFANNTIKGFWCELGLSEHAIHVWTGSRDTLIEGNLIVNSARAIGLGMGRQDGGSSWRTYTDGVCGGKRGLGHYGGLVRNNTILINDRRLAASQDGADSGISVEGGCDATIVNNTVVSMVGFRSSAIEWRFSTTDNVVVANNLTNGRVAARDGANGTMRTNVTDANADWFRSVDGDGDLHLSRPIGSVVRGGSTIAAVTVDKDGYPREQTPDVGAYQYRPL